jgi:hypothetical protein
LEGHFRAGPIRTMTRHRLGPANHKQGLQDTLGHLERSTLSDSLAKLCILDNSQSHSNHRFDPIGKCPPAYQHAPFRCSVRSKHKNAGSQPAPAGAHHWPCKVNACRLIRVRKASTIRVRAATPIKAHSCSELSRVEHPKHAMCYMGLRHAAHCGQ